MFDLEKKSIRKMAYNERISEDLAQSNRKENDIGKYIFFSDIKGITSIKNVLFCSILLIIFSCNLIAHI